MSKTEFAVKTNQMISFFNDIRYGYVDARLADKKIEPAIFACSLVSALARHKGLIALINKVYRIDLKDSLVTHNQKYIDVLTQVSGLDDVIVKLKSDLDEVVPLLLENDVKVDGLDNEELDEISQVMNKVAARIQTVFAEQNHNEEQIDGLIAITIAMYFDKISFKERVALSEDFAQMAEIWKLDKKTTYNGDSKVVKFLKDQTSKEIYTESANVHDAIAKTSNHLISYDNVLVELSDDTLSILYNRIRNNDRLINYAYHLFCAIHREAKYRYSCNKLSDSCYDLMSKFQKLDALIGQVDALETSTVETFLVNHDNFAANVVAVLQGHIDNIRALKLSSSQTLMSLFIYLEKDVQRKNAELQAKIITAISGLKEQLAKAPDPSVYKKYDELDHFHIYHLQKRYTNFFENVIAVIDMADNNERYISDVFTRKIVQDYYVNNLANNVVKIRAMDEERERIKEMLGELSLISIFTEMKDNKIKSIDLRTAIAKSGLKAQTPEEYVSIVTNVLISVCTAFQLGALLTHLMSNKDNTSAQVGLKEKIAKQVAKRISFVNMIKYKLTGKGDEYSKLQELQDALLGTN